MEFHSKYFERRIKVSADLVCSYNGGEPFHLYLRKFFKANKKYGSKDRKEISALCYNYFRVGKGILSRQSIEDRIRIATRLISACKEARSKNDIFKSDELDVERIFPFHEELSPEIDRYLFGLSFLIQPFLYLRIRPGHREKVITSLQKNQILFEFSGENSVRLENSTNTYKIFRKDAEVVIQDFNSQNVMNFFPGIRTKEPEGIMVWDACAGSGGKSILVSDYLAPETLIVSDIRKSILENLKKRFLSAGIKRYKLFQADLTKPVGQIPDNSLDLIIADVPCSGSGTWSRTPENLLFFRKESIAEYISLQRNILRNIIPKLNPGGYLLYVTCSVFARENEKNINFLCENFKLKVVTEKYLKGYDMRADTLFIGLLRRN